MKKSQANIITVVLLIMIALISVIIVWNVVRPLIKKSVSKIGTEAFTVSLEIKNVELFVDGGAKITVKRGKEI